MIALSDYDEIVSQIYEAALVPARWDVALTSLVNRFGPREWEVAMLVWERLDPPMGRFIGAAGVNELARDAYIAMFAGRHDWTRLGHTMKLGRVAHSDELVDRESFKTTPFYRQYLQHYGFEVALIGILDRHASDHMGIVCPGPGDLDPGDLREAIAWLTPHFRRAARIGRRIGEADLRAASALDLLDSSPYSVMALGPDLELVLANRQGQALLGKSDGLRIVQGRIAASDPAIERRLRKLAAGQEGDRTFTFLLEDKGAKRLLMTALAVDPMHSARFASAAGGTALMLIGGQDIVVSEQSVDAFQQAFGLTAAEARLAAYLVEGSGVRGYAAARGVSLEAGKYLLKSIYAKTGLSNQTELTALLREAPLGWGQPIPKAISAPD